MEEPVEQAAFRTLRTLRPVEVWGSAPLGPKNVQFLETSRLYQLPRQKRMRRRKRRRDRLADSIWTCNVCVSQKWQYFVLPGDWNAARVEFGVEVVVDVVQSDSLHRRKLLQVLHVIAVHQSGLKESNEQTGADSRPVTSYFYLRMWQQKVSIIPQVSNIILRHMDCSVLLFLLLCEHIHKNSLLSQE